MRYFYIGRAGNAMDWARDKGVPQDSVAIIQKSEDLRGISFGSEDVIIHGFGVYDTMVYRTLADVISNSEAQPIEWVH